MKRLFALFILLFSITGLFCQTYFYADTITIEPVMPTDEDSISIIVSGSLSDTGSQIDSVGFNVIGNELFISMNCSSVGGFQVIVPHEETINIGMLEAGDYHINLQGIGLGDFITDTTQYYFYVCDEIAVPEIPGHDKFIRIYPNPVVDKKLNIYITEFIKGLDISIYNSEGRVFYTNNRISIDQIGINVTGWQQGVYFICFEWKGRKDVEKLVVW